MTEQWFTFPIINEIAIEIGPIAIRWYALAYLAGIFTTMLLMNQEAKKDSSAFEPEDITRLTNFCVIGIIIGGRLGFVLFYNFDFLHNLRFDLCLFLYSYSDQEIHIL